MNRTARLQDIKERSAEPTQEPPRRCSALGCVRVTQRSAGNGLSDIHCKKHVEFRRRHGSTWRKSYTAQEIGPYREAARLWLRQRKNYQKVADILAALDGRLQAAGRSKRANEVRWELPGEKARIALARLREGGHTAEDLLVATLTIKATQAAMGPRADVEFRNVQIAKLLHRLASGTHRTTSGFPLLGGSRYPRAEGTFMRILGHMVEDVAGIVANEEAVNEVLALAGGVNSLKSLEERQSMYGAL